MVFLHGYGANKECFLPQINYFSRFYRVTAFDFRGFGQSQPLTAPWSVSDYAEETREILKSLGVCRPSVVAHSFGGRVAVKLAAMDGTFFDKMVLTGAAGIILKRGAVYRLKIAAYRAVKRVFPSYAENLEHFPPSCGKVIKK